MMTRRKVKLAWIKSDTARKASLKKRKACLVKMVQQLVTLCGVRASIIVYSPGQADPEIWPPSVAEVRALVENLLNMPMQERSKKMMDQEGYIKECLLRCRAQFRKLQRHTMQEHANQVIGELMRGHRPVESLNLFELEGAKLWIEGRKSDVLERLTSPTALSPLPTASRFHNPAPAAMPTSTPSVDDKWIWEELFTGRDMRNGFRGEAGGQEEVSPTQQQQPPQRHEGNVAFGLPPFDVDWPNNFSP